MSTKLVVAGSRDIRDKALVRRAIEDADLAFGPLSEIVHGGARGVDSLASVIAHEWGIDTVTFEPEWDEHGRAAGPIRNWEMAEYGDALVAVWDGESHGTKVMIEKAMAHSLDIIVIQSHN